jgi:hypothetical protein
MLGHMHAMRAIPLLLLLITLGLITVDARADRGAADTFAVGDARGLWIVRVLDGGRFNVTHRVVRDQPGVLRPAIESNGTPIAATGTGRRLDLFYKGGIAQSIRFGLNPEVGLPTFDVSQLPALPPKTRILAAAATDAGPMLLVHRPHADQPDTSVSELLTYAGTQWEANALPMDFNADLPSALIAEPDGPTVLMRTDTHLINFAWRNDKWRVTRIDGLFGKAFAATRAWNQRVVIDQQAADQPLRVTVIDQAQTIEAGVMNWPDDVKQQTWHATSYADRASVIIIDDKVTALQRDLRRAPQTQAIVQTYTLTPWPAWITNRRLISYGLFFVLLVTVVLALRPSNRPQQITLPDHLTIAPLSRRGGALLIDMLPSMIIAMVVMKISNPLVIIGPWLSFSDNWGGQDPAVMVVLITGLYTLFVELAGGADTGQTHHGLSRGGLHRPTRQRRAGHRPQWHQTAGVADLAADDQRHALTSTPTDGRPGRANARGDREGTDAIARSARCRPAG